MMSITFLLRASSLIKINEATAEELQQLKLVGPKRAAKIIKYRDEVEPISSENTLASVTGLSIRQIANLSDQIDWQSNEAEVPSSIPAIATYLAIAGFYFVATGGIGFSFESWDQTAYNILITVLLIGCALATTAIFASSMGVSPRWATRINYSGILVTATALAGMMLLVIASDSTNEMFKRHLQLTTSFLTYVLIIFLFLYLPRLHLNLAQRISLFSNFRLVADSFDIGQILLGLIVWINYQFEEDHSALSGFFLMWLGIVCLIHSFDMYRGKSAYLSSLSDKEIAKLFFLISQSEQQTIQIRYPIPASTLLAVVGICLVISSLLQFF